MSEAQKNDSSGVGCLQRPKFFGSQGPRNVWFMKMLKSAGVFSWDQFLCNSRFHPAQGELASQ